jgi:UTP--glucose-1-phosphate uridylyltransferase
MIIVTGRGKNAIEDHFDVSFELEALLEKKGNGELLEQVRRVTDGADFFYVRQNLPLGSGTRCCVRWRSSARSRSPSSCRTT